MSANNTEYNWIYEQLVQGENDLVGAIAYILYKQHKIEFIHEIKQATGSEPSNEQWIEFHRTTCLNSSITNYQNRAETLVQQFLTNALTKHAEELDRNAEALMEGRIKNITQTLKDDVQAISTKVDTKFSELKTDINPLISGGVGRFLIELGKGTLITVLSAIVIWLLLTLVPLGKQYQSDIENAGQERVKKVITNSSSPNSAN